MGLNLKTSMNDREPITQGTTLELRTLNIQGAVSYLRATYTGQPDLKCTVVHAYVKGRDNPVSFIHYPESGWFIL